MEGRCIILKEDAKKERLFYGYTIEASAFVIMAMAWGANRSFGVFLEPLLNEFGWSRTTISGAFTLSMIVLGIASLVAGKLTDRIGPKKVLIACALFLGSGYLLMSRVTHIWEFYLYCGVMTGIGVSGMYSPLLSLVARWFVKRRALMTGILVAGPALGITVVPFLLTLFITSLGWRLSCVVLGVTLLITIIPTALLLKRDPDDMNLRPYGDEHRAGSPSLQLDGFTLGTAVRTSQFWMLGFIAFCSLFTINVYVVHIVIHAIGLGLSSTSAAMLLSLAAGISIAGRIIVGVVADRIGNKLSLILCYILAALAYLFILSGSSMMILYLAAVIFGAAGWGAATTITPLTASLFGLRAHGTILAHVLVGSTIGGATGPVLIGYVYDITGSYRYGFLITLAVIAAAMVTTLLLKPMEETDKL